jgi:hypothetical protein
MAHTSRIQQHIPSLNYVMNKDGERQLFHLLLLSVARIMQFQWCMNKTFKLIKVFGKVMYWRLYQPVYQNNILVDEQYGFRINSSTLKASYTLINNILLAVNNKLTVSGIFCGLEKAFWLCESWYIILEARILQNCW